MGKINQGGVKEIRTYEFKLDEATGVRYAELTEEDGCKYVDNLPAFESEEDEKKYIAGLEKAGYVDLETAARMKADNQAAGQPNA